MNFLELEGISGNSLDLWHPGQLDVQAFSLQPLEPAAESGTEALAPWTLQLTLLAGPWLPALMAACHSGRVLPRACLTQQAPAPVPTDRLRLNLQRVRIAHLALSGQDDDILPVVSLSLHAAALSIEVRDQNPDGSPGRAESSGWLTASAAVASAP